MPNHAAVHEIINALVARYRSQVCDLDAIERCMLADGVIENRDQLVNDHVAFRTLGAPHLGIASLERVFVHYGYVRRDAYDFPAKHLDANWYSPPSDSLPRLFISELRIGEVSADAARTIHRYTNSVVEPPLTGVHLDDPLAVARVLLSQLWPVPSLADYRSVLAESEYAAWTIVNGYQLNHMTLSVHELRPGFQSIATLNPYLEDRGVRLNEAGGKIKISPDGLLRQSSTLAQTISATFAEGETTHVAGPYIEFAERRVLPQFAHLPPASVRREHRREGFEAANADRIFESTAIARSIDCKQPES